MIRAEWLYWAVGLVFLAVAVGGGRAGANPPRPGAPWG